jgi:hypothetical protein
MKTLLILLTVFTFAYVSKVSDESQRYTYATERINRIADSAITIGESADNAFYNAIDQVNEECAFSAKERRKLMHDYYLIDNKSKSNF